jgi:Cu(I)/Ag(I) efflux system membrane fusion protein
MFVEMALSAPQREKILLIPSEALIRTGRRTLVMVTEADGSFRPVEVETGIEAGGKTEIRRGLLAGQKVVLSGQFLIDSEASLKGVGAPGTSASPAAVDTHRTGARIEAIAGDVLTLTHPPIPALQWPAMTMDFRLAPDLKAPGLGAGQEIEIEFRMQEGEPPRILSLRRNEAKGGAR